MKKRQFFVPKRIADTLPLPPNGIITLGPEIVLQTQDGFYTRGVVLDGPLKEVVAFISMSGLRYLGSSITEECDYSILSRKLDDADITIEHQKVDGEERSESEKYPTILGSVQDVLGRLAGYTGLKLRMHFHNTRVCNPFTDGDTDTLHIIVGASPPGAVSTVQRQHSCGVRLDQGGLYVRSNGPTAGRGHLIKDVQGLSIGQMEEKNLYLFTPKISRETSALFSSEGGDLLRKMLQQASKTLADGIPALVEFSIQTSELFKEYVTNRMTSDSSWVSQQIEQEDKNAEEALADYRRALYNKRNFVALQEHFEKKLRDTVNADAASDWTRLSNHPLVEQLIAVGDALHVKTKRIVIEEDGHRYDLGAFVIRLEFDIVSVWSTAPTHPRGIAHPHISEQSSLCFGNAGTEIQKAASELRFADAIGLIIEWLRYGYDPTLANVKIEEWPLIKEEVHVGA